jgi:endonuclease-3 related protein
LTLPGAEYNFLNMQAAANQPAAAGGTLLQFYATLIGRFGPQRWWPARTRLEIILGAILTQNTAWHNAALALKRLRRAGRLSWAGLRQASLAELEECIRPAGFYRQKARTIRNFIDWLARAHQGSLHRLFSLQPAEVRRQLLELKGWGAETADAVLLYAGRHPFFVADAYTRRILWRHGLLPAQAGYGEAQEFLHRHLLPNHLLFNELHALLVEAGKKYCKREAPQCEACPLEPYLVMESRWPKLQTARPLEPAVRSVEIKSV